MHKFASLLLTIFAWANISFAQNCPPVAIVVNGAVLRVVRTDSLPIPSNALAIWSTYDTAQTITVRQSGVYSVQVKFPNGCVSFASPVTVNPFPCTTTITSVDTGGMRAVSTTNFGPVTYAWTGGATTQVLKPRQSGTYCVTVRDARGCTSEACKTWSVGNDCGVDISIRVDSVRDVNRQWIQAFPKPPVNSADWSYAWSTGETTTGITVQQGDYCVTITNRFSKCTASKCIKVEALPCTSSIRYQQIDNETVLNVISNQEVRTYRWSTGATTSSIIVKTPGTYSVTVTSVSGCVSSAIETVVGPPTLNVTIFAGDTIGRGKFDATLFLLRLDDKGMVVNTLTFTATNATSAGGAWTRLPNLPAGKYLLKAELLPSATRFGQFLPTYSPNSLMANGASVINIPAVGPQEIYARIQMIPKPGFTGTGNISGTLRLGSNNPTGDARLSGASIILMKMDSTPVATAILQKDGRYELPNLPWGTYLLMVDMPGMRPLAKTVVIGPTQPTHNNQDFALINGNLVLSAKAILQDWPIQVTPNPTTDLLWVTLPEPADLIMQDIQGRIVFTQSVGRDNMAISMHTMPSGVYQLTARTKQGIKTVKVVKI